MVRVPTLEEHKNDEVPELTPEVVEAVVKLETSGWTIIYRRVQDSVVVDHWLTDLVIKLFDFEIKPLITYEADGWRVRIYKVDRVLIKRARCKDESYIAIAILGSADKYDE